MKARGVLIVNHAPHVCSCGGTCGECVTAEVRSAGAHLVHAAATLLAPLDDPYPAPEYPPAEWFNKPDWLQPGQRLTITDEGQVAGYFYERGVCHIDGQYPAECWMPSPSPTGYAAFHQADVVTADGDFRQQFVGVIGNTGGHASPYSTISVAQRSYADPNTQVILCRAADDEIGGYIAGAIVPGLTFGDIARVRRCSLSGDWRPFERNWWAKNGVGHAAAAASAFYDCLGPTLVNRPGLPTITAYRAMRAASAGADDRPVYLGGMGGVQLDRQPILASASSTVKEPDTMADAVRLTMPDGTAIDLPDGASIASRDGQLVVDLNAGDVAAATDETAAETPPVVAEGPTVEERLDDLAGQVSGVVSYVDEQRAAQAARVESELDEVREPVTLPDPEPAPTG